MQITVRQVITLAFPCGPKGMWTNYLEVSPPFETKAAEINMFMKLRVMVPLFGPLTTAGNNLLVHVLESMVEPRQGANLDF